MEQKNMMDETTDGLISLNALAYKKLYPLSVCSSSQWRVFRALRDGYTPSSTAFIDIAAGASFIDPRVSYLAFDIAVQTADGNLGIGNALNFLQETVVRSRSGVELSRSQEHGFGRYHQQNFKVSDDYYASIGSGMSQGNLTVNTIYQYALPLSDVNPFFSTNVMLPSMIGQMRLEITWSSLNSAFIIAAPATSGFIINNLRVVTKTYDLADAALKRIAYNASQVGLTIPYIDSHHTLSVAPGTLINVTAIKSASRAISAYACPIPVGNRQAPGEDPMSLSLYTFDEVFQYSLGSQYLTSEPVKGVTEAMIQANHAFGLWGRADDNISNRVGRNIFSDGLGIMAVSLERSHVLQYNGSAVSSARPLLLSGILSAAGQEIHLFLCYLRMAVVFSDSNVSLKE